MVRAKLWDEDMQARFPEGTFIEAVLNEDESRTGLCSGSRRAGTKKASHHQETKETIMATLYRHDDKDGVCSMSACP